MTDGVSLIEQGTGEIVQVVDAAALLRAGGLTDVATANPEALATFDDNAKTLKAIADEARGIVSDELVRRRDREVGGTLTVGGWKIVVPSKAAGATKYDTGLTVAALERLVEAELISATAAAEACPEVTPPASLPWAALDDMARALDGQLDIADEDALRIQLQDLLARRPAATHKPIASKLDALCKHGGAVAEAITACKVDVEPPRRVAKITRAKAPK